MKTIGLLLCLALIAAQVYCVVGYAWEVYKERGIAKDIRFHKRMIDAAKNLPR